MARARAVEARDRQEAAKLALKAVEDLEGSVNRGMKSSGTYLKQARELASNLKETVPAPDPRLEEAGKLIEDLNQLRDRKEDPEILLRRCDDSAAIVKGTPHQREWRLLREGAVRTIVDRFQDRVRETLPPGQAWATLKSLPPPEFDRRFALPKREDPAEPALEWSRNCRERLLRVRAGPDPATAPLPDFASVLADAGRTAIEAALREGENRSFVPLEALIHDLSRLRLERLVSGADAVSPGELRARRQEGEKVIDGFKEFIARLDKELAGGPDRGAAFRRELPSHLKLLEGLLNRFPEDLPGIDEIGKELFDPRDPKGVWGDSPLEALKRFDEKLSRMDPPEAKPLTRDSRQKLATYLLVARASLLLLSDEGVEDIARSKDFREIGRRLHEAGGPLPEVMKRVSPKIRLIAEKLEP